MPQMNNPLTGEPLDLSDEDFAAYSAASTDLAKPGPTASGRVTISNPITGEAMSLTPDEAKLFGGVPEPMAAAEPPPDTDINHPFLRGAGVGTLSLAELAPLAAAGAAHLFQKTPLYHELSWVGDQMQRIEPRYLADAQKAAMAKAGTPEDMMFKYGVDPIEHGKANLSPQANEDWTFWKKVEFGAGSFVPTLLSLLATKGASAPEVAPLTSFLLHGTVAGETMGVPATASQAASEVYQGADLGDVTKHAAIDFPINMAMGYIPGALPERWLAKAFPGSAVARGTARAAGGATIGTGLQAGSAYAQGQTPDASDLALGALLGGSVAVLHPMLTHDGLTPEQAQSVAAAAAMAKDSGVEPEMISAIIGRHRLSLDADAMVSELQTAANASAAQQVTATTSSAEIAAHHANTPMGKAMAAARAAGIPDDMITHTLEAHPDNEILAIRALQGLSTPSEEAEDVPRGTIEQTNDLPGNSDDVNVKLPTLEAIHGDLLGLRNQSPEAQTAVLQGMPRRIHEYLAENPPTSRLVPLEAELQGLRQDVPAAREVTETVLSDLRGYRESNASPGLHPTAEGGVAVPEVPSGGTSGAGPGLQPERGDLRGPTGQEPAAVQIGQDLVSRGQKSQKLLENQAAVTGNRAPYPESPGQIVPAAPGETGGGAAGHGRPLVGHANWQGIPVNLEFAKGDRMATTNRYGEKKQREFSSHYGEIPGTVDKDGDPIDTYVGPDAKAKKVWVVNQASPRGEGFDEHKVMMGYGSEAEARTAYMAHFEPGWKGLMSMVEMTPDQLKTWMKSGDTQVPVKAEDVTPAAPVSVKDLAHPESRKAIDTFKDSQKGQSLDDMYQRAVGNQARLVEAAKSIEESGVQFHNPGIKARARTIEKFQGDGYDSPHRLADIVRGGFTVDSPEAADRVMQKLSEKFPLVDKGWEQNRTGYIDRKLLVRFPDGQVGEVQLWEPNFHRAKTQGGGHALYALSRGEPDTNVKTALVGKMQRIYSDAAGAAGPRWSGVLSDAAASGKADLSQANDLLPPDSATEAALTRTQEPGDSLNMNADNSAPPETETSTAGRLSKSTTESMAEGSKGNLSTGEPPSESIARKALTEGIPARLPRTKRAAPVFMRAEGAKVLRSDQGGTPFRGDRTEIYTTSRVPDGILDGEVGRVFPSTDRLRTPEDVRGMLGFTKEAGTAGIVVTDDLNRPIAVLHHPPGADLFAVQDAISQLEGAARFWTTENQAPELIDALRDSLGLEHAPGEDVPAADDRQAAMASMGETLPAGVRVEDLKAEVSRVLAKHESGPNMPNVTSVQDVGEIPARLTRDAMAMKADHLLSALYDPVDDRIWTIANGFDSTADVERKLFHESLHMGLRRYLGTGLDPFLKRVAFTYGKAGLQDIANRYGYDLSTERGTRLAAEEKLAQLAETMDKPALWDSFTAFVKQWLNKRGFGFDLNPDELQATVASISRRTLRGDLRSVGSRSDNRVRYSMRPAAMTADIQAISDRIMAVPDEAKTLGQRVRDKLSVLKNRDMTSIKQGLLDGAASLEKMERGLTGGDLLDASQSAYKSYYATKNLSSVMAHIMLKGVPEFRNGSFLPVPGRKGLVDIFRPIVEHREGDMLRQWELYAAANRAKRLILEKNPDGTSRENLFTQPEIDAVMKLGDKYPEFKKALADYQEFNKQLLDLSEDRGVLNPEERAMWERNDYVPFYRAMEDMAQSGGAGKGPGKQRGLSGQRAGIRRLKGGDEKLGSILENIVLNTSHLVDASYKNEAMRRIVDLGDGIALRKVSLAWQPTAVSHSQMINALNEAGLEVKHITPEIEKKWATIFRRVAPMGPNIVSVMKGGKPEYYEVSDPLLYRTITSMGTKSYGTLMNIFRFSKHLLTTSITADPGFMVRNFTRDTLNTLLVSDAKITPVSDALKNFIAVMKDDPDLLKIMAAGYGGGGYYDTNPKDARKILARAMAEKSGTVANTIVSPKRLWWAYQRVGNASEMANRLTVYKSVVKGGGTTAEGAYQANDLLNFAKSGDYAAMQFVVQTVPFLNARIQGTYKVLQGAKAHPFGFAMKAGALMAASMALAGYNQDNPEYEALPDYDKDTYWHIFAGGQHFRIPKPFEIGAMFATVPERIMRTLQGRDTLREFGQRMGFMFQSTFAFGSTGIPFPQAIEPFIQQYANKSGFTGAPIVPESMQNVDPEAQYTPYTSETMKMLGANMPDAAPDWMRSPVRLQAAFESYTGTLGQYALAVSDKAVHELGGFPVEPAKRYYDYPVVSSFVRDPVMKNTHGLEQLYDMQDRADEAYNTLMKYQKEMNLEAMQKQMTEHGGEIAVHSALDGIEKSVAAMNNQIRLVYMNTSMDAEQKRNQIDQLTLERNAIAEQALQFTANMDEHPF